MTDTDLQEIIRKVNHGDGLTDGELMEALRLYARVSRDLRDLGPHFHLAWKEVYITHQRLEGYLRARKGDGSRREAS